MDPPQEPSKPEHASENDAALAASAANAVEQWRTYQNAYALYQQQHIAYQEYMQKQATLSSYEEQQAAYQQYLANHQTYQRQLEQYEQQKSYQEFYASGGASMMAQPPTYFPTTAVYQAQPAIVPPVFTTPMANLGPFYAKGNDHQREPSSTPKYRSEAREKRTKVYTTTNFYANPDDEQLFPADLKALFKELDCGLCKCKMNSHISANVHYQSKVHEKKIVQYLKEWCERTGTPMPYRARRKSVPVEPVGPNSLRCEACDLPLTSIQHANQHYTGKRHQMVVSGKKNPAGKGYYNKDGHWTRSISDGDEDPHRFGIGQDFANQSERYSAKDAKRIRLEPPPCLPPGLELEVLNSNGSSVTPAAEYVSPTSYASSVAPATDYVPTQPTAQSTTHYTPQAYSSAIAGSVTSNGSSLEAEVLKKESADCVDETGVFCKVCQIAVTSATVMETHLKGTKHLRKLKSVGRMPPPGGNEGESFDSILSTLHKPPQQNDWSLYRMPSGKYYCKTCNTIIADKKLFSQHWYGKKHKLKVKQEMEELTGTKEKKRNVTYKRSFVKATAAEVVP